uniref:10 kDa heat shock protein, mitochondrial n=1 Tax=Gopherus evgoodei TaxID=1825980 RepID=A0A8C5EXU9_9SAUR
MAGKAFRKFLPLFDRVLVERCAAETVTKGGIMLPEKSQGKVLQATVVAVGSGSKGKSGEIQPVSVKVGEKILLPEYGGTKVVLEEKVCLLNFYNCKLNWVINIQDYFKILLANRPCENE